VAGIVLGAAYLLWLYQRTMFGEVKNPANVGLRDVNLREAMTLIPLVIWAFWIGIYPKPYFQILEKPVAQVVERVNPDFYRAARPLPPAPEPAPQLPEAAPASSPEAAAPSPAETR
jgi:NADH-quinone oxidoreductase subunit M